MPEENTQSLQEFIAEAQPSDKEKLRAQEFVESHRSTTSALLAIASMYTDGEYWEKDPIAAKLLTDFAAQFAAHEMTTF